MRKLIAIEKVLYKTRRSSDRRSWCDKYIVSYMDNAGIECRKGYELPVGILYSDAVKLIPLTIPGRTL